MIHTRDLLHFLLLLFFLATMYSTRMAKAAGGGNTGGFVYAGCSAEKFSTASAYVYNLNSLLSSLANSAGLSPYNNFTSSLSTAVYSAYGLYQCRADISVSDCESCVSSAISRLTSTCPTATSATIQLRGCLVRYSNESFVGRPGKELLFKSCGPVGGGDLTAMRESVFQMLKAGSGFYRVGRSGYVDGSAQCVGDQTAKQCNECVSEAAEDLRSSCDGAVSGEVYLGKCSAEYWSKGAPYSAPYDRNQHVSEAGKDIAIIIGIVAAVLLIILFLNHLKKSSDEKGKY